MATVRKVPILVGYPKAQKPSSLGVLHRRFGVRQEEKLDVINGYVVELPEDQVDAYLEALPAEASAMMDTPMFIPDPRELALEPGGQLDGDVPETPPHISRPEGLEEIHGEGIDGSGVTICVIDSGITPHADFGDRIKHFQDFSSRRNTRKIDPYGHGTHVSGIAVGNGEEVDGIAPDAELISLRIQSPREAIKAIEWAIENKDEYGIDVINMSLGVDANLPSRQDPFSQATQRAIDAGLVTVVAAGNEGRKCEEGEACPVTISTPGILPDAITVGAYYDGGNSGIPEDDVLWRNSSRGPTAEGEHKPDLVALGVRVLAPKSEGSQLGKNRPAWGDYMVDSGTSAATPMVAGACALLLEANPELSHHEIKEILTETASKMDSETELNHQGAGRLNLLAALERARAEAPEA